jgi:hypothetical protein
MDMARFCGYFAERDLHFELQEGVKSIYPSGPYYVHPEWPGEAQELFIQEK